MLQGNQPRASFASSLPEIVPCPLPCCVRTVAVAPIHHRNRATLQRLWCWEAVGPLLTALNISERIKYIIMFMSCSSFFGCIFFSVGFLFVFGSSSACWWASYSFPCFHFVIMSIVLLLSTIPFWSIGIAVSRWKEEAATSLCEIVIQCTLWSHRIGSATDKGMRRWDGWDEQRKRQNKGWEWLRESL